MKEFVDSVIFFGGHSCIIPNKPWNVDTSVMRKILEDSKYADLEKFGLFESSTPNYYTYYPDTTPEDFVPKDEDFINPVFRLLSKTVVNPTVFPTDFSYGNVLKDSMPLLVGQSIFIDHETVTGNVQGAISETFWQDEVKLPNGKVIPAGINGVLKIDAKANPRTARAINMDPPAIHSDSVSIRFKWKKSHEDMSDEEFRDKLGTFDSKGELVRRVATKILAYSELSLVPHGADPFAKKLGNKGIIVDPGSALMSFRRMDTNDKSTVPLFIYNFKELAEENFSEIEVSNNNNSNNSNTNMELQEALSKITLMGSEIEGLKLNLSAKDTEIADLQKRLSTAEAFKIKSDKYDSILQSKREQTISNYKALNVGKEDSTMVEKLTNCSEEVLDVYAEDFSKKMDETFPLECSACHGTDLTRRTSVGDEGNPPKQSVYSDEEAIKRYRNKEQK